MAQIKTVEEIVNEFGTDIFPPINIGYDGGYLDDQHRTKYIDWLTKELTARDKAIIEGIKEMSLKRFEPADAKWVGKKDFSEGEYQLFPAKDRSKAMYCLNCERFLYEERCNCGFVFIDDVINLIKNK